MAENTKKHNLTPTLALVQLYGECLSHLRHILDSEAAILEKSNIIQSEIGRLLDLRTHRCQLWMALQTIAMELDQKHGFRMPGVTGWRVVDEDRFHLEPFPSLKDTHG
jgi:hypothetical protein